MFQRSSAAVFTFLLVLPAAAAAQIVRVPADASLQNAFGLVPNGGVIEISAGSYVAPVDGFRITNPGKSFTVRSASGAAVFLDGANLRPVLVVRNSTLNLAPHVVFENLTIRNGRTTEQTLGAGISVHQARVTFTGCRFENNSKVAGSGGGGGGHLRDNADVTFESCVFESNDAFNKGGALALVSGADVRVTECQFLDNRTNLPGHDASANGGAIHMRNSSLHVVRSRFEGNEAGVLGGAIIATAFHGDGLPAASVTVDNSTFADNHALNDPGVTPSFGLSGGAIYVEDRTTLTVRDSRFYENSAEAGGAIATYRAAIAVEQSVFRGNKVTGDATGIGTGGAFSLVSGDTNGDGNFNAPPASLAMSDSLVQCRYGATGTAGRAGGAIIAGGDKNRQYGTGGITPMGTVADNISPVVLERVAFADCDVTGSNAAVASGAIEGTFIDLDMTDVVVIDSDALTSGATGGVARLTLGSDATVVRGTFAGNSAVQEGGAFHVRGSTFNVTDSQFFDNAVSSANGSSIASEPTSASAGDFDVLGTVADSFFVGDSGRPLNENDSNSAPINDLRYDNNTITTPFSTFIFKNDLAGSQTVAGLNGLTVTRTSAGSTAKSQVNNTAPVSSPSLGVLLAVPSFVQPQGAVGDPAGPTEAFLVGAWTGTSATLDGSPLLIPRGVLAGEPGKHVLDVDGQTFTATIRSQDFIFDDGFESGDTSAWSVKVP